MNLGFTENMRIVYIKSSITSSISLFYTALTIYGSVILVENGIKIKDLFSGIFKFIISKEALKLFIILLLIGLSYQPINIMKSSYMFNSSLASSGNLFSFMDILKCTLF